MVILNTWQFTQLDWEQEDIEPVFGDPDYDYGTADDGTPNPPPCPVCGVPLYACTGTSPNYPFEGNIQ